MFRDVNELLDDDASVLAEEDDGVGCPLPSTPEDEHLLDCEVRIYYGILPHFPFSFLRHITASRTSYATKCIFTKMHGG